VWGGGVNENDVTVSIFQGAGNEGDVTVSMLYSAGNGNEKHQKRYRFTSFATL
jgi:hypothetical protein